jgi:hypothetical protein
VTQLLDRAFLSSRSDRGLTHLALIFLVLSVTFVDA